MMTDADEAEVGNLSDDDEIPFLNLGRERYVSDKRQLGGLCLVLGTCAAFQPLATIASLVGMEDENTSNNLSTLETIVLTAAVLQFLFGSLAMVVGYLGLVHDYGHYILTGSLILFTQLGWVPFITGMVEIGQAASGPFAIDTQKTESNGTVLLEEFVVNPFIPPSYLPTQLDVQFFGAMGIIGIMAYGTGFLGSLAFTEFALYAFDVGKPTHRDARYFRGRLAFYSFVLALAGVSQLLLGSYILFEFGGGPLSPAMGVAMYQIYFPEITVALGCIQMVIGYIGIARYLSYIPVGPSDHEMQAAALLGWVFQLVLQYIVQISYMVGDENAAAMPSLALLSLGMNLLPAYLDFKMRTTPHYLTNEYYGITDATMKSDAHNVLAPLTVTESKPPGALEMARENGHDASQNVLENPEDPSIQDEEVLLIPQIPRDTAEETTAQLEPPEQFQSFENTDAASPTHDEVLSTQPAGDENAVTLIERDEDVTPTALDSQIGEPSQQLDDGQENVIDSEQDVMNGKEDPQPEESTMVNTEEEEDQEEDGVIIIEEYVEYPEDYNPSDHDRDDSTPPQSNKSIERDMEDTWEKALTPPKRLSPLEEEDTERILAEDEDDMFIPASTPRGEVELTADALEDPDGAKELMPTSARSVISEYSMDYSTPSDDSVALEAKINRLQQELLSDTDMESYLNNIL
jgi:hypothetical protein